VTPAVVLEIATVSMSVWAVLDPVTDVELEDLVVGGVQNPKYPRVLGD
jgi:hypothetical protein